MRRSLRPLIVRFVPRWIPWGPPDLHERLATALTGSLLRNFGTLFTSNDGGTPITEALIGGAIGSAVAEAATRTGVVDRVNTEALSKAVCGIVTSQLSPEELKVLGVAASVALTSGPLKPPARAAPTSRRSTRSSRKAASGRKRRSATSRGARATSPGRTTRAAPRCSSSRSAARPARETEAVWEFYLNVFNQRAGPFGAWLGGLDRIALDCYRAVYLGLGRACSIPSPAPLSYMEAGFGPATFRRGVRLARLGRRPNPFPLVKVPYHRLLNPWSLGAVPDEVAHNLQSDLGLWEVLPGRIGAALAARKVSGRNAAVWRRWHKETFADLAGTLLIGPAYVGSLVDVVGRSRESTAAWNDEAVHPTPIIRVPLNLRLLERMGFGGEARAFRSA